MQSGWEEEPWSENGSYRDRIEETERKKWGSTHEAPCRSKSWLLSADNHEQMSFAREGKRKAREEEEGILLNHRITSKVISFLSSYPRTLMIRV